jgi:ABC-type long-chain fatty acid transport system, fused permease and ATPase components
MISKVPNEELISRDEVIARIKAALANKQPFSFVRIGDGENFVLSQDSVYTMEKTLSQQWVKIANQGRKGIRLPNLEARDQLVEAIREADIVGVLAQNDNVIRAHPSHKRELTNRIFDHFQLRPEVLCNAIVNRDLINYRPFWDTFQGSRLALISRWAGGMKQRLIRPPYNLNVAFTLPFERNSMMAQTLEVLEQRQDEYDAALISCGVNAVILAHMVKKRFGKVGIDFGIGAQIVSQWKI